MVCKFITFEGGEGAGKTTQIRYLKEYLEKKNGVEVVCTREPGGTLGAEKIRELLVRESNYEFSCETELLLILACRLDHLNKIIIPALNNGKWVLCDRFIDSTLVYQGIAQGIPQKKISDLHSLMGCSILPDLTFYLDLRPEEGLGRSNARLLNNVIDKSTVENKFENKSLVFHKKIREGFISLANSNKRIKIINASNNEDIVFSQIKLILEQYNFKKGKI